MHPNSETLARLIREMLPYACSRTLDDMATSYALRADVDSAAFLALCGLAPSRVSDWPMPGESRAGFSGTGPGFQNIPRAVPVAAAGRAKPSDPGLPTGTPGDALQDAPAISPCEISEFFEHYRRASRPTIYRVRRNLTEEQRGRLARFLERVAKTPGVGGVAHSIFNSTHDL